MVTETTCGLACWTAKQEVCRCSCGGKNHGIMTMEDLLNPNVEDKLPVRKRSVYGVIYHLVTILAECEPLKCPWNCSTCGWTGAEKEVYRLEDKLGGYMTCSKPTNRWEAKNRIAFYHLATPSQYKSWPEISSFDKRPYLIWVREGTPHALPTEGR